MPLPRPSNAPTPTLFSLSGLHTLITGGARGIGLSITQAFAESGCASIALTYSTSTSAPQIAADLSSQFPSVSIRAYKMDVRDAESVKNGFEEILRDNGGRLDVVVANAGVTAHGEMLGMEESNYRKVMGTNLDGAWFTAQEAGRVFKGQAGGEGNAKRKGNLIFTGSVSAELVNLPQQQAAYNASKAGMVHLARCLAVEWAEWGGRVNCVSPGFIETDMIETLPDEWKTEWNRMVPGKRFCAPYELKGVYVFLASEASSYMTGANITVDGGYTLP